MSLSVYEKEDKTVHGYHSISGEGERFQHFLFSYLCRKLSLEDTGIVIAVMSGSKMRGASHWLWFFRHKY